MSKKKEDPQKTPKIRGTHNLTQVGVETDEIRSLILRRRLQILVHSCIYYELDSNLVSDRTWSTWAQELVKLQKKYPGIAKRVDYAQEFQDFDGSTGFNLPTRNPEIMNKALYLLKICKGENDHVRTARYKNSRANSKANVVRVSF